MNNDNSTEAARAEADERWPRLPHDPSGHYLNMGKRVGFELGASWARDHYAAQEPTDAEVLAALNAHEWVFWRDEPETDLAAFIGDRVPAMRAALTAAREARP